MTIEERYTDDARVMLHMFNRQIDDANRVKANLRCCEWYGPYKRRINESQLAEAIALATRLCEVLGEIREEVANQVSE